MNILELKLCVCNDKMNKKYNKNWRNKLTKINPILAKEQISLFLMDLKKCDNLFHCVMYKCDFDIELIPSNIKNKLTNLYFNIFINIKHIKTINQPSSLHDICISQILESRSYNTDQKLITIPKLLENEINENIHKNLFFFQAFKYHGVSGHLFLRSIESKKDLILNSTLKNITMDIYIEQREFIHS